MPRLSRDSPDFGSRQVIVHSITASSPCSIPCSYHHLPVQLVDRPAGVLGDLAPAVGAEPRVVVDRVVREVRGDQLDVAGVQRLVVGADVVEVAHGADSDR